MSKPEWVMTVPVISTVHLPGPGWNTWHPECAGFQIAATDQGWFFAIGQDSVHAEPAWVSAMRNWVMANFGEDTLWIRFDADGAVIAELENFDYVWEAMEGQK